MKVSEGRCTILYQHGRTRALFIGASSNQNQRNHKSQSESKGKYREEPIRTQGENKQTTQSAGKRGCPCCD